MTAMERAMQGRTTFIVAHRLSTLRRADLVMVLDHGRVTQVGTHEQLMDAGGHYRDAALLQQANPKANDSWRSQLKSGGPDYGRS